MGNSQFSKRRNALAFCKRITAAPSHASLGRALRLFHFLEQRAGLALRAETDFASLPFGFWRFPDGIA